MVEAGSHFPQIPDCSEFRPQPTWNEYVAPGAKTDRRGRAPRRLDQREACRTWGPISIPSRSDLQEIDGQLGVGRERRVFGELSGRGPVVTVEGETIAVPGVGVGLQGAEQLDGLSGPPIRNPPEAAVNDAWTFKSAGALRRPRSRRRSPRRTRRPAPPRRSRAGPAEFLDRGTPSCQRTPSRMRWEAIVILSVETMVRSTPSRTEAFRRRMSYLHPAVQPDGPSAKRSDSPVDEQDRQADQVVRDRSFRSAEFRPAPGRAPFEPPFRVFGAEDGDLGVAVDRQDDLVEIALDKDAAETEIVMDEIDPSGTGSAEISSPSASAAGRGRGPWAGISRYSGPWRPTRSRLRGGCPSGGRNQTCADSSPGFGRPMPFSPQRRPSRRRSSSFYIERDGRQGQAAGQEPREASSDRAAGP